MANASVLRTVHVGLHFYAVCPEVTEFGEITQNKGHYAVQSFKVTDFGTNRKLIYDFLLVINTNLPLILHRFQDIGAG